MFKLCASFVRSRSITSVNRSITCSTHPAQGPAGHRFVTSAAVNNAASLGIDAHFKHLMKDLNLTPSEPQQALLKHLGLLQRSVEAAEASGVFDRRFKVALNELRDTHETPVTALLRRSKKAGWGGGRTLLNSFFDRHGGANVIVPPEGVPAGANDLLQLCPSPYEEGANYGGCADGGFSGASQAALRSAYIWGGVGQGKTLIMDAFFDSTKVERKVRVHFHNMMLDIQKRLHELSVSREIVPFDRKAWDKILRLACDISQSTKLLCLDEFHVVHITDAMILRRLFEALLHFGCVVVTTSNRPPEGLYENGLNRARFVPFIDLVREYWNVYELDVGRDWRRTKTALPTDEAERSSESGMSALSHSPTRPLTQALAQLESFERQEKRGGAEGGGEPGLQPAPREIDVAMGRRLSVAYACGESCLVRFSELCAAYTGTADFIALSENFSTVFLFGIPHFTDFGLQGNEIRRFIQLIDVLYERHIRVVFDSERPLLPTLNAFAEGEASRTGDDNTFAFARTASRINEMLSAEYLADFRQEWARTSRARP